jgi:uncharacterized membrane protein
MTRHLTLAWALLLFLRLPLACLAQGPDAGQALQSSRETRQGQTFLTIENPFLALTFDPARGGRCNRFVFKDTGEQLIGTADVCGMFLDHWAKYAWPSGLMWLPYEASLVGDGKARLGIRLQITVPPKGGGKGGGDRAGSLELPTSPDLIGLVVSKTVWMNADNDVILVEQEIRNPTAESRAVAPYIQHNLTLGGSAYKDNWYMPSGHGVVVRLNADAEGDQTIGPDWVPDPTAGWMAVRDRATDRGLLFAFDYNYVQKIYTCGSTAEWFMESVPVGPGKSFAFQYLIKPVRGFRDFVYGSRRVVADIRPDEAGPRVHVTHEIAATQAPLKDVRIAFTVTGWKSKQAIADKEFTLTELGFDRAVQEFDFEPGALADGVVIRAVVRAAGEEERYEYYYAGDQAEYESRHNYFATKGGALAGAQGDAYFVKPPRKQKALDKPDFAQVAQPDPARCRVLVVFGLYTHILNLDDALAGWKSRGGAAPEFTWANCPPNAIETFPGSYDELFAYDAVVLSDVNFKAIGATGFEMLCDYAEQGGRLLVTGGPYALGNGEFEETRFLEVLPVTLSGPFDLKWAGKGQSWELLPADPRSPLLAGVSFEPKPKVFWHHVVTPKAGASVVLQAGDSPVLILGGYGKGKVALLTLSPTGKEAEGEIAWWNWNGWFPLLRNVFTWLDARE